MYNKSLKTALASAVFIFSLNGMPVQAANEATSTYSAAAQPISLLNHQLTLVLPSGFEMSAMPPGTVAEGQPSARGRMYINKADQQLVITTQMQAPSDKKLSGKALLAKTKADFYARQRVSSAKLKVLKEKTFKHNGLTVQQLDFTATLNGTPMRNTAFIAAADTQVAIVQMLSDRKAETAHKELVEYALSDR